MATTPTFLFHTHEFAQRAGVTVRALHHYDRLGLLKPSRYTDAGYRLYGERDFARLQQIVVLKFIGLPLKEIKRLLEQKQLDLPGMLRVQREIVVEKRRHLETVIQAIERAEEAMRRRDEPDWETLKQMIEVINMQNDMEWVKKYYTEEQLAELAQRGTPDVLERGQRDWADLLSEVEKAVANGVDPQSEKARSLAARWTTLIEAFTGGNPGIMENLTRLYADQPNWPSSFSKPYSDEVGEFLRQAAAVGKEE